MKTKYTLALSALTVATILSLSLSPVNAMDVVQNGSDSVSLSSTTFVGDKAVPTEGFDPVVAASSSLKVNNSKGIITGGAAIVGTLQELHEQNATIPGTTTIYSSSAYKLSTSTDGGKISVSVTNPSSSDTKIFNYDLSIKSDILTLNPTAVTGGNDSNKVTTYFEWVKDSAGNYIMQETSAPSVGSEYATASFYNVTNSGQKGNWINRTSRISGACWAGLNFVGDAYNSVTVINGDSGGLYRLWSDQWKINGNYIHSGIKTSTGANGGIMFNHYENNGTGSPRIINGNYLNNFVEALEFGAVGYSAVYLYPNSFSPTYKITGNYIGNYAYSAQGSANGSAISINQGGTANTTSYIISNFIRNYVQGKTSANTGAAGIGKSTVVYLIGDFFENYAYASNGSAQTGALALSNSQVKTMVSDFIGNYAKSTGEYSVLAGAWVNGGGATVYSHKGNFIVNYAESNGGRAAGGAIYNAGTYTGFNNKYFGNYALTNGEGAAQGGAIFNSVGTLNAIDNDFIGNHVEGGTAEGGAIYNDSGTINLVSKTKDTTFVGNTANGNSNGIHNNATININTASSGADTSINSGNSDSNFVMIDGITGDGGTINVNLDGLSYQTTDSSNNIVTENITQTDGTVEFHGDVKGNDVNMYAGTTNVIADNHSIEVSGGTFTNNNTNFNINADEGKIVNFQSNIAGSGDVNVNSTGVVSTKVTDINDDITTTNVRGTAGTKGTVIFGGDTQADNIYLNDGTFINSGNITVNNVLDNKVTTTNTGTINGHVINNADKVINNSGTISGTVDNNANALINTSASGLVGTVNNDSAGKVVFVNGGHTQADYVGSGRVEVNSPTAVILDSNIDNNTLALNNGTLVFGANRDINKFEGNGGLINAVDGALGNIHIQNAQMNAQTGLALDFDLTTHQSDLLNVDNFAGSGLFNVKAVKLQGNLEGDYLRVHLGDTTGLGRDKLTSDYIKLPDIYRPIRKLNGSVSDGWLTYDGTGSSYKYYNPAVMTLPVQNQIASLAQLTALQSGFHHSDAFMNFAQMKRAEALNVNKYAINDTPIYRKPSVSEVNSGMWIEPNTTFEKVDMKGGPGVSNVAYGTLYGGDTPVYKLKNGYNGVISAYIGYNGNHIAFDGVSMNLQGGNLGVTGTLYKGNFFTALALSTGAASGEANTMYGREHFTMLSAGVGSKTGYNWELAQGKFIIQPSVFAGYTFVNTFDYTNAAGVRMHSDPLHTISVAPSVKFIANLPHGWQPYAKADVIMNFMGKTDVKANDVRLPQLSVKPYVQYGVGVQKSWGERFTAHFQTMFRSGGRQGIVLTLGFRWALGKGAKDEKVMKEPKNHTLKVRKGYVKPEQNKVGSNEVGQVFAPVPNVESAKASNNLTSSEKIVVSLNPKRTTLKQLAK